LVISGKLRQLQHTLETLHGATENTTISHRTSKKHHIFHKVVSDTFKVS